MSNKGSFIDIRVAQKDFYYFKKNECYLDNLKQILYREYLGLVKYVVRKMIKNFPNCLEEEDLYQIGITGLHETIERFNPNYGIKFETYAIPRIKGSIIDELRKLNWIPRSIRAKLNTMNNQTIKMEQIFPHGYTDEQTANRLGVDIKNLHNWKKYAPSVTLLSLNRPLDQTNKENLYDVIPDENYICPHQMIEDAEIKTALIKTLKKLPAKTRIAISLYYYEKLTFKKIGKILNVSESRISQIHSETMLKLKKEINKMFYA